MIRPVFSHLRQFRQSDAGSAHTIEFVLWVPLFLFLILATVEIGSMSVRHTQLERSLDSTVRAVRLGTGQNITHDMLKASICAGAPFLRNCDKLLKLEMVPLDLRNWSQPAGKADCVDTSEPVNPVRNFTQGGNNEMMFLRACYKYHPINPAGFLARALYTDGQGYASIVSYSAFVQEPS